MATDTPTKWNSMTSTWNDSNSYWNSVFHTVIQYIARKKTLLKARIRGILIS